MLIISERQMADIGDAVFLTRVDAALLAQVAGWGDDSPAERRAFLQGCLAQARSLELTTEQSVVSYALGACWLGIGFESASPLLLKLLAAPLPELRRCHGMNEWVADQLHRDATADSGDDAIRRSFALTEPWGRA